MVDPQLPLSNENEINIIIRLFCPICKAQKEVLISKKKLLRKEGLTTIAIPKDFMCLHSFLAFVDRNGKIRGYQKNDLEIITDENYEKENKQTHEERDSSKLILKLKIHLGDEIFLRCIKNIFNNIPICCITNNVIIKENLRNFFYQVFGEKLPPLFIISLQEYNHELRMKFQDNDDAFIFNTNLCIVIKEPYEKEFNEKNFELEQHILNSVDFNTVEDSLIMEKLTTTVSKLFNVFEEIKTQIEEGIITNKTQILNILKKVTGKKFSNKDILDIILLNRYNLDIKKKFLNQFFDGI